MEKVVSPHTPPLRNNRLSRGKGPDSQLNKVRLITFTDFHDESYSFYHFILFLYVLSVLFLYTTYGCTEDFPDGRAFVIASIVITALPVLLAFRKVFTAQRDHKMKATVACTFLLLATVGSYGIFVYSDDCDADVVRFNVTVAELTDPRAKTRSYNLFTLRDGQVAVDHMFSGQVNVYGRHATSFFACLHASPHIVGVVCIAGSRREVQCAAAPLASSATVRTPAVIKRTVSILLMADLSDI